MDGPREIVIPEQRYVSCGRCSHYSHSMVRSGQHPIYADNCKNPELYKDGLQLFFLEGNLHTNMAGVVETPEWCPFLGSKTRKVLLEKHK